MAGPRTLTVLGTTDLHGHLLDWDYHCDRRYFDDWGNAIGLARVASVVRRERAHGHAPILIDDGDFLQGTPLAVHAARGLLAGRPHPMAVAMNALGFDAAVVGNHEFDFGLDVLRAFEKQTAFPLLAGNVRDRASGDDAFVPYVMRDVAVPIGRPVRVAIVGLTQPGTGVWNRAQLGEALRFDGLVESAHRWVSHVREGGADVVIVAAHSGLTTGESAGAEHAYAGVDRVAEHVPGIDAILAGHAHREVDCQPFVNATTGAKTIATMPMCWGMRVSAIDITVERAGDGYRVVETNARLLDTAGVEEDHEIVRLVEADHRAAVDTGRTRVGSSAEAFGGRVAPWRPSPLASLIQHVQAGSVDGHVGTRPILAAAPLPHHAAAIPCGVVLRRAIDALTAFESRTVAVAMTGADVRNHLEVAATYFAAPAEVPALGEHLANASSALHPTGTPDFAYDTMLGYSAPLRYEIDLARPPGDRITSLTYAGAPVTDDQVFAVAITSHRRTGAYGYTAAATAPVLYECEVDARTWLIDWIASNSPIRMASFHHDSWRLTYDGDALEIIEDEVST